MAKRILIVSDDQRNASMRESLAQDGFTVTAADVENGFRQLLESRFDLVVVNLSDATKGLGFIKQIRANSELRDLLILTVAEWGTGQGTMALTEGVDGFEPAPVDSRRLVTAVASLLRSRLLSGLGLARRAGDLTSGFEKVSAAIDAGKAAWLIEASDGAADGRRKLLGKTRKHTPPTPVFGLFTAAELGLALGGENVIHTAFLAGRAADRWAEDALRLSGFRPLLPESWREEPG